MENLIVEELSIEESEFDYLTHGEKVIMLRCKTGETVEIEGTFVASSGLLRNLIIDFDLENPVDLSEMSQENMRVCVDYMKNMKGVVVYQLPRIVKNDIWKYCSPYEKKLLVDRNVDFLIELMEAASFLDISRLTKVVGGCIACVLYDKSAEEIREMFGLENDLKEDSQTEDIMPDDLE